MKSHTFLIFLCFPFFGLTQVINTSDEYKQYSFKADSAFKMGNYALCGVNYESAFAINNQNFFGLFRAAKCFALDHNLDKSFLYLNQAVDLNWKYTCQWLEKDKKLANLHPDPKWQDLLKKCGENKEAIDQELKAELLKMRDKDQELRNTIPVETDASYAFHLTKLREVDEKNTKRMKEIIEKYGWPGTSLVGEVGTHAAWLLVQHADANPFFQEKCLTLLEKAYEEKEASGSNYAYLHDRVMVNKGEKQLFGTQVYFNTFSNQYEFHPIEKEAMLNERRVEYGLQWSAQEYAEVMGFEYDPIDEKTARQKVIAQRDEYEAQMETAQNAFRKKEYETATVALKRAMTLNGDIQKEDLLEGAKMLTYSKADESEFIFGWLKMAVAKGWTNLKTYKKQKVFRKLSLDNRWDLLKNMIENRG